MSTQMKTARRRRRPSRILTVRLPVPAYESLLLAARAAQVSRTDCVRGAVLREIARLERQYAAGADARAAIDRILLDDAQAHR